MKILTPEAKGAETSEWDRMILIPLVKFFIPGNNRPVRFTGKLLKESDMVLLPYQHPHFVAGFPVDELEAAENLPVQNGAVKFNFIRTNYSLFHLLILFVVVVILGVLVT